MGRNEVCVGNVEIGWRNPTRCNSMQIFLDFKLSPCFESCMSGCTL